MIPLSSDPSQQRSLTPPISATASDFSLSCPPLSSSCQLPRTQRPSWRKAESIQWFCWPGTRMKSKKEDSRKGALHNNITTIPAPPTVTKLQTCDRALPNPPCWRPVGGRCGYTSMHHISFLPRHSMYAIYAYIGVV